MNCELHKRAALPQLSSNHEIWNLSALTWRQGEAAVFWCSNCELADSKTHCTGNFSWKVWNDLFYTKPNNKVTCLTCKCVFLPSGIISVHISFHHGASRSLCGGPRAGVEAPRLVWRPQGWCGGPRAGVEAPGPVWRPQCWYGGPRAGVEAVEKRQVAVPAGSQNPFLTIHRTLS